jgi:hypothetical protein
MQLEFSGTIKCYNGAFDSASQRVINNRAKVLEAIRKVEPEAHITFHYGSEIWIVHVWGKSISGEHKYYGNALLDACDKLGVDLDNI